MVKARFLIFGVPLLAILIGFPIWMIYGPGVGGQDLANEGETISVMTKLCEIYETWKKGDFDANVEKDYFVEDFSRLGYQYDKSHGEMRLIKLSWANADPRPKASFINVEDRFLEPLHGFYLVAMTYGLNGRYRDAPAEYPDPRTSTENYGVCAFPADYGMSGKHTFIVDKHRVIWKKDLAGCWQLKWPAEDPATEGWQRVN